MSNLNFNGLNSSGVATGEYVKLIGQTKLKDKLTRSFNANSISTGNKDSIILNIFGNWGLGKSHIAFKLFSEINGLVKSNGKELVANEFSNEAVCVLLNYKFIDSFDLKFLPRNIALSAAYWLDDESYSMHIGNKDALCFQVERDKIIHNLHTSALKRYNNQFNNHKDEDYYPFEALRIFLNENNKKRLIIIIDEIEELEHVSRLGYTRINISNLYEQLVSFVSTASKSKNEKYRIGFVFLISQEMYDKVKEFVEETETSSARRFENVYLKRYSREDMKDFLKERLSDKEREFIDPFIELFLAIWEASNRNFGWFEVAAKNLCLELSQTSNPDIKVIERALMKTKKNKISVFNQLGYKSLINRYQSTIKDIVDSYCLKAVPQKLESSFDLIKSILATCGEVSLKIDEVGDIYDPDFSDRLKKNKSRIKDMISFENSLGSIPAESIIDSLYKIGKDKFLTYFPDKDFQFHLTWAANRKLDLFFTEKLKDSLNMKESSDFFILSTEHRRDIYPFYKPNITANWISAKKLREIREFIDS